MAGLQPSQQQGYSLGQLFALANSRSGYTKAAAPDKIWQALTVAGRRLYFWIVKENSNFFVKWDTTTIALVAAKDEYACPPDLAQVIRFSERSSSFEHFRRMTPVRVTSDLFADSQYDDLISAQDLGLSDFVYAGPYLPEDAAQQNQANLQNSGVYNVRLAPMPVDARQTELIYIAKFLELRSDKDFNVIPPEGRDAQLEYAVAMLLRDNDDGLADKIEAQADKLREEFLTFVRDRQFQQMETQQPYVGDLD